MSGAGKAAAKKPKKVGLQCFILESTTPSGLSFSLKRLVGGLWLPTARSEFVGTHVGVCLRRNSFSSLIGMQKSSGTPLVMMFLPAISKERAGFISLTRRCTTAAVLSFQPFC